MLSNSQPPPSSAGGGEWGDISGSQEPPDARRDATTTRGPAMMAPAAALPTRRNGGGFGGGLGTSDVPLRSGGEPPSRGGVVQQLAPILAKAVGEESGWGGGGWGGGGMGPGGGGTDAGGMGAGTDGAGTDGRAPLTLLPLSQSPPQYERAPSQPLPAHMAVASASVTLRTAGAAPPPQAPSPPGAASLTLLPGDPESQPAPLSREEGAGTSGAAAGEEPASRALPGGAAILADLDTLLEAARTGAADGYLYDLLFVNGDAFEELVVAIAQRANVLMGVEVPAAEPTAEEIAPSQSQGGHKRTWSQR